MISSRLQRKKKSIGRKGFLKVIRFASFDTKCVTSHVATRRRRVTVVSQPWKRSVCGPGCPPCPSVSSLVVSGRIDNDDVGNPISGRGRLPYRCYKGNRAVVHVQGGEHHYPFFAAPIRPNKTTNISENSSSKFSTQRRFLIPFHYLWLIHYLCALGLDKETVRVGQARGRGSVFLVEEIARTRAFGI